MLGIPGRLTNHRSEGEVFGSKACFNLVDVNLSGPKLELVLPENTADRTCFEFY